MKFFKKRALQQLEKPLYLNANLIYSEALNSIKKQEWKREIKSGTLTKLKTEGFSLVTSILTRMEVIQRLCREENLSLEKARVTYNSILNEQKIMEITSIENHTPLNDAFIDQIAASNLDFKDALHLQIAKKLGIPVCTHDKKERENFSQHPEKSKFYDSVFKPQELIKPKDQVRESDFQEY